MSDSIQLHIICRNLPGSTFGDYQNVQLGIQRGKEIIDEVAGDSEVAEFHAELKVRRNDDTFAWSGPFAHGSAGAKFIYLCWTAQQGETREMFRRAKIHFSSIPHELVERALRENRALQLQINMTDERGGPLCASVKNEKLTWALSS